MAIFNSSEIGQRPPGKQRLKLGGWSPGLVVMGEAHVLEGTSLNLRTGYKMVDCSHLFVLKL